MGDELAAHGWAKNREPGRWHGSAIEVLIAGRRRRLETPTN
jgi:hypothetical protein